MKARAGFDGIAPYYDRLKSAVFAGAIEKSQRWYLNEVPVSGKLLIVGGGTGEILPPLLRAHPAREVWFVDTSSRMLQIAKRRLPDGMLDQVTFVQGTIQELPPSLAFDCVITNFFLDLFRDDHVGSIINDIAARTRPDAVWLVSDFVDNSKYWQRVMLKVMYLFFSTLCGIEAKVLPRWQDHLRRAGIREVSSTSFYGGFIKAAVYRKENPNTQRNSSGFSQLVFSR